MTDKQLSINDILNIEDCKTQRVDVPEWGGYVMIKSMTAEARDAYEFGIMKGRDKESGSISNIRAQLAAACVLSPSGERMFSSADHVKMLGKKSAAALDRIVEAAQKVNALTDEDIEELQGNSQTDQP